MAKGKKTGGRKKGTPNKATTAAAIQVEIAASGEVPLDYMLRVMRDPGADPVRRDRMAIAAAPFCHVRVSGRRPGKKDMAEAAARTAGRGSEWGTDLN
jgi:hypothetical protein